MRPAVAGRLERQVRPRLGPVLPLEATAGPDNLMPGLSQLEAMKLTTWHIASRGLPQGTGIRNALARHALTLHDYRG